MMGRFMLDQEWTYALKDQSLKPIKVDHRQINYSFLHIFSHINPLSLYLSPNRSYCQSTLYLNLQTFMVNLSHFLDVAEGWIFGKINVVSFAVFYQKFEGVFWNELVQSLKFGENISFWCMSSCWCWVQHVGLNF